MCVKRGLYVSILCVKLQVLSTFLVPLNHLDLLYTVSSAPLPNVMSPGVIFSDPGSVLQPGCYLSEDGERQAVLILLQSRHQTLDDPSLTAG